MTPQVSSFIPGSLEDTDKHIDVTDGHHVTENHKGQVQIKMCDKNRDTLILSLYTTGFGFNPRLIRRYR